MQEALFGKTKKGEQTYLYTMRNSNGVRIAIADFGGAIQKIVLPAKAGDVDIVLGYDDVVGYENQTTYIGSLVGRVCNRIADGQFTLNGKAYQLACNNGKNHLHGGTVGFDKKIWQAEARTAQQLHLSCVSPAGEAGYPGELQVSVDYVLTDDDRLIIDYMATADQDTLCSLTNHTYFNLDGYQSGAVDEQQVQILADKFTPTDATSIPTGELCSVEKTPLDFRQMKKLVDGWDSDYVQIAQAGGYDHNYVVPEYNGNLKKIAVARAATAKTAVTIYTDLPGLQFYSGNYLNPTVLGKGKVPLSRRSGYCFESQYFPNAINEPRFITPILRAGNTYRARTVYALQY